MKKLITCLGPFLLAAGMAGQAQEYVTPLNEVAVEKNQTAGSIGGGALSDGDYGDVTVGGSGTTMTLDGGSNPTFTLFKVGNGATGPGSFDILEDTDNGSNYIRVIGQSALSANRTYTLPDIGGDGTVAVSPTLYPGMSFDPTAGTVLFDDMYSGGVPTAGTRIATGLCHTVGAGASSGYTAPTSAFYPADGTAPGVVSTTTGTTSTGTGSISCGISSSGTTGDSVVIRGGEIIEWRVMIPNKSVVTTAQFKTWIGLCDNTSTNGACVDGLYVYWDDNVDTHWGCGAVLNTAAVETLSNLVATQAVWHKIRIEVNSNATSVAYKVDGAALSCSPITDVTKIPTGVTHGAAVVLKVGATAGCAAATTCQAGADYVYFYQPVTR